MTVTAVLNQKGGVGKTTATLNLAYSWASRGRPVLVVDVDKQAAATASLVPDLEDDAVTLANVLRGEATLQAATRPAADGWGGLVDVVASSLDLEDVWAARGPTVLFALRRALEGAAGAYDHVLLDGPPDLGPATVAAAVAADVVVIPTRPERMAMHGVARTVETVEVVARDIRPDVRVAGIVPVAVDGRLLEHRHRVDELRSIYGATVTATVVPHRLRSDESSGAGLPAAAMPGAAGVALGAAYRDLADELDGRGTR